MPRRMGRRRRHLPRILLNAATMVSAVLCLATAVQWMVGGSGWQWPWRNNSMDFRDRSILYRLYCGPTGYLIVRYDLRGEVKHGPAASSADMAARLRWEQQWANPATVVSWPGIEVESTRAEVGINAKDDRLELLGFSSSVHAQYWLILCVA